MLDGRDYILYVGVGHKTVINRLTSQNIVILRAKSVGRQLFLVTKSKDRQKIVVLFDELCYNYKIIKSVSSTSFANFIKTRPLLLVGVVACILTLLIYPMYLNGISICGDSTYYDDVNKIVSDFGIKKGTLITKVDKNKLSQKLQSIDGVSFVDVSFLGNILNINIKSELKKDVIIDVGKNTPIVSQYDAVLTRQLIFSGSATHKAGDIIKKGDFLISPQYFIYDKAISTKADGQVYGIVNYTASIVFKPSRVERVKSGKSYSTYIVDFLGLKTYEKPCSYKMYEKKIENLECGFLIPLTLKKITYYEIIDKKINESFDDVKDNLLNEVLSLAQKQTPYGARIINKQTKIRKVANDTIVEAVISCEHRIDIFINDN